MTQKQSAASLLAADIRAINDKYREALAAAQKTLSEAQDKAKSGHDLEAISKTVLKMREKREALMSELNSVDSDIRTLELLIAGKGVPSVTPKIVVGNNNVNASRSEQEKHSYRTSYESSPEGLTITLKSIDGVAVDKTYFIGWAAKPDKADIERELGITYRPDSILYQIQKKLKVGFQS